MRLTLLSLPLLSLVSSQAVWSAGDGTKWLCDEAITSAIVADDVADLSTGEENEGGEEKGVFQHCSRLEAVRLPESLIKIGNYAFNCCDALLHVDFIPSGVNELGKGAFSWCKSLETVTIPEGIVDLPNFTFYCCTSLMSVKLPSSLKTIGRYVFQSNLRLATINDDALEGVTEIGHHAFFKCSSLKSFKLPPLLKTLEAHAFHGCESLSKVELPSSLESMKEYAVTGCAPNLCIDLPETIMNIKPGALQGCRIRLPTSLSMLTNGGDVRGLLHRVKGVAMSSRANLSLLLDHINNIPSYVVLDPNLKFNILYSSPTTSTTLPPLKQHFPESFFTFDVSTEELKKIGGNFLHGKVHAAFMNKISVYAGLMRRKTFEIPKDVLYVLLPFLYGKKLAAPMLNDIVAEVGELLGRTSEAQTTVATS